MDSNWQAVQMPHFRPLSTVLVLIVVVIVVLVIAAGSSIVSIGGNEVGIVEKKVMGAKLPPGRILAVNGENGIQAQVLAPGWHFWKWAWQYKIEKVPVIEIKEGYVGLVQVADGQSLPEDTIYAPQWQNPDKMLDAAYFLSDGKGFKGPQLSVLNPGKYRLNTKLFTITPVPVTNVTAGSVAVIKSNVGQRVVSEERLVEDGQRGIREKPLAEGKYYLHTKAYEVTMMSIRQVKVSYSKEVELGEKKTTQPLKPINVRTKDGIEFPVAVRVTYKIEAKNAPRIVATVGDDEMVLAKLVTPSVKSIFRNNAEQVKALDYVQNRSKQEEQSALMLKEKMSEYGVTILEVLIDDVGDKDSLSLVQLLKTQTDREIALQEQATFEEQQRAAEKQKALSKTEQEAEEEKRLATAAYSVQVAEQEKQQVIINAQAEAEQIKLVAEAQAQAYKLISSVIGPDNAALIEIMKLVANEEINITPEVMVGSGGSGVSDALMGTILKGMVNKELKGRK